MSKPDKTRGHIQTKAPIGFANGGSAFATSMVIPYQFPEDAPGPSGHGRTLLKAEPKGPVQLESRATHARHDAVLSAYRSVSFLEGICEARSEAAQKVRNVLDAPGPDGHSRGIH